MNKKTVDVSVKRVKKLFLSTFASDSVNTSRMIQLDVSNRASGEIYSLVCKLEKKSIADQARLKENGRNVIYYYLVSSPKIPGHSLYEGVNGVYLGGKEMRGGDLLLRKESELLSEDDDRAFDSFASSLCSAKDKSMEDIFEEIAEMKRIVKVPGVGRRKSFFKKLEDFEIVRPIII